MQGTKILTVRFADLITHLRTPLYRNGYFLIASTVITSVLGFVYWALAARIYQPEDVGLNSAAISIMIFLSGISQLNLQEAMVRYVPLIGKRIKRFIIYSYLVVLAISAAVAVIYCLGLSIWSPKLNFINQYPAFTLWFIATVMIWGVFVVEDAVLTGLRQTVWVPVENAIFAVIKIVLLFMLAMNFPTTGIFVSWTGAVFLVVIPINFLIFRRLLPKHSPAPTHEKSVSIRQVLTYVAGNYIAALLVNGSTALLPLIITQMLGPVANAYFYVTWIIAGALQVISSNMATSLTVEGAINKEQLNSYKWRVIANIWRLLVPVVVITIIAAPLVLRLMGRGYADEGVLLLRLLTLSALANAVNTVYVALARVKNQVRTVIYIYGANAVAVLTLSYLLLPQWGITGVGVAWLVSQSAIAMVVLAQDAVHGHRQRGSKMLRQPDPELITNIEI